MVTAAKRRTLIPIPMSARPVKALEQVERLFPAHEARQPGALPQGVETTHEIFNSNEKPTLARLLLMKLYADF